MARVSSVSVPMSAAMASLTINVRITGMKVARARLWLGTRVMMLAAVVIGCGIEFDAKSKG